MKLVKNTRRWYDDACGTALAMELVGERWSLLIVRELMFGARRFADLKRGLGGISANILAQRLEGLAAAGILRRRRLPPPANVDAYELTALGLASERAIQELGRWAVRSSAHDPTLPLSAASLMMSFRTMYAGRYAGGGAGTVGFRLDGDGFVADLGATIDIVRDDPARAQAVIEGPPTGVAAIVYGGVPLADAAAAGLVRLDGDRSLLDRFVTCFPLPAKLDVHADG